MFPGIDFIERLGNKVKDKKARIEDLDYSSLGKRVVISGKDFYDFIVGNLEINDPVSREIVAVANEKKKAGEDWTLEDLNKFYKLYKVHLEAQNVDSYMKSLLERFLRDIGWGELIKFASVINNDEDFYQVLRKLDAVDDSSLNYYVVPNTLSDAVRYVQGKNIGVKIKNMDKEFDEYSDILVSAGKELFSNIDTRTSDVKSKEAPQVTRKVGLKEAASSLSNLKQSKVISSVDYYRTLKKYVDASDAGGKRILKEARNMVQKREALSLNDLDMMYLRFYKNSAVDVLSFAKDLFLKFLSDIGWEQLIKVAEYINNYRDYNQAIQLMKIAGNSYCDNLLRISLAEAVKKVKGVDVSDARYISAFFNEVETDKQDFVSKMSSLFSFDDPRSLSEDGIISLVENKRNARSYLDGKSQECRKRVYSLVVKEFPQLFSLADKYYKGDIDSMTLLSESTSILGKRNMKKLERLVKGNEDLRKVKEYKISSIVRLKNDIKYGDEVVVPQGSEGEIIGKKGNSYIVLFDDLGVIVNAGKKDLEFINKKSYFCDRYIASKKILGATGIKSVKNGTCPVCGSDVVNFGQEAECYNCCLKVVGLRKSGKEDSKDDKDEKSKKDSIEELEELIGVGSAVRVEGDPGSPYYGRIGIVHKILSDGWVGVHLRDNTYIERFIEDLSPVSTPDYEKY